MHFEEPVDVGPVAIRIWQLKPSSSFVHTLDFKFGYFQQIHGRFVQRLLPVSFNGGHNVRSNLLRSTTLHRHPLGRLLEVGLRFVDCVRRSTAEWWNVSDGRCSHSRRSDTLDLILTPNRYLKNLTLTLSLVHQCSDIRHSEHRRSESQHCGSQPARTVDLLQLDHSGQFPLQKSWPSGHRPSTVKPRQRQPSGSGPRGQFPFQWA